MKKTIYLILDNIRSRENVGSIFRTADAVGVSRIYLCGITPTPLLRQDFGGQASVGNPKSQIPNYKQIPNSKISRFVSNRGSSIAVQSGQIQNSDKIAKTALGAEKWVPWEYRRNTWQIISELKKSGIMIVALEQTKDSIDIFSAKGGSASGVKFKPKFPIALVVGNEVRGISPKILKYCDKKISIPMYGRKESLNVSVAAGIALYTIKNAV